MAVPFDTASGGAGDPTAFVALAFVVLTLFLGLARLSQGLAPGDDGRSDSEWRDTATANETATPADTATASETTTPAEATGRPTSDPDPTDGREAVRGREMGVGALSPGGLLLNVALTQGVFGGLVAAGAVVFAVPPASMGISGAPLSTGLPAVAAGVAFGVVLWLGNEAAATVADAAGATYDEGLRELLAPESPRGWVFLLGATLPLIAVVEELLFRAAAIGATSVAFSTSAWALAVVSSLAFALGHGAQGRVGMVVTGGLGFALAAGFVLTDSFLVVVIAHYLVNALEFGIHEGLAIDRPIWAAF